MCVQGIYWGLFYIIHRTRPYTFEELVARAHEWSLVSQVTVVKVLPLAN